MYTLIHDIRCINVRLVTRHFSRLTFYRNMYSLTGDKRGINEGMWQELLNNST